MTANIVSTAKLIAAEHRDGKDFHTLEGLADLAAAYQVQKVYVGEILGSDRIAGYKIGLTSKRMQAMCGIDHPISGAVFGRRVMKGGVKLGMADFHHLGLEFEICARLGRDLPLRTTAYTKDEVATAVDGVCAAIELVDDRKADYAVLDCRSLVADNSWNAGVVLGPFVAPPSALDAVVGQGPDPLCHSNETPESRMTGNGHVWVNNNLVFTTHVSKKAERSWSSASKRSTTSW